jgi:hypothetical protein
MTAKRNSLPRRGLNFLKKHLARLPDNIFMPDRWTAPYPDSWKPSLGRGLLNGWLYRLAAHGIALRANERNILKYKGSCAGRRIFIIGNGPSLNKLDLTKLKGEITIGVNSIFLAHDKMGFHPTHYVVEDIFVAEDRAREIAALKGPQKWFGNYLRYCLADGPDVNWINVRCRYDAHPNFPDFSTNIAREAWTGGSVTYICMQLAYFLGAREIYLIGFDHSYTVPKEAEVAGTAITSTSDDPNHFHPDYFGKGYRWHDPMVERMEMGYRKAGVSFEKAGGKIRNATAGGHLECFERVDYDSLFRS